MIFKYISILLLKGLKNKLLTRELANMKCELPSSKNKEMAEILQNFWLLLSSNLQTKKSTQKLIPKFKYRLLNWRFTSELLLKT